MTAQTMPKQLDIAVFRGREYFIDRRLRQLRPLDNPHEFIQYENNTFVVYKNVNDKMIIFGGLLRCRSAARMQVTFEEYL